MTQLLVDFLGERKARKAMEETWGHLRPPSDHDYPGTLLVSHSEYPDQGVSVVAASFPGVPDSPWFYGALTHWVFEQMTGQREGMRTPPKSRPPGIYEFQGIVRVSKSGESFRFIGRWTKMSLYPGRIPATKPRGSLLDLGAALRGKRKYIEHYVESDVDYCASNRDACVRFLDTMNARRKKPAQPEKTAL